MAGRSRVSLDVRREEFYEGLVSFFGFTQVSRIAVCESTNVSVAEGTNPGAAHDVAITTPTEHEVLLFLRRFSFRTRRTYLNQIICEGKFSDG